MESLRCTVDERAHPLHVGVPPPLGTPVRVADVHAERRLLAADVAHRCHGVNLPEGGRGRRTRQAFTNSEKVSIPCHDLGGDPRRPRAARRDGGLPRRPAPPPDRHQPAQRLPGARRRHGHQHGPDARGRSHRARCGGGRRGPGRGVHGHRAWVAHGGPGELGRHPLPALAGHERAHGLGRGGRRGSRAPRRRHGPRLRAGPAGRGAAGRGDDPHGGRRRGGRRHAWLGPRRRARARRGGRRRVGAHAPDAPGAGPGRRRRRRRLGVPPPARRLPPRPRRASVARALGGRRARPGRTRRLGCRVRTGPG